MLLEHCTVSTRSYLAVEGLNGVNGVVWCLIEIFFCKMSSSGTAVICNSSLIPESALLMSRGHKAGLEGDWKGSLQGLFHRPVPPEISTPQYQLRHFVINKHTWGQLTDMIYVATHVHIRKLGHIRKMLSEML